MRISKKIISTALAAALIVSAAMPSYAGGFVRAGDGAISMGGEIYRLDQTTGMTAYSLLNAAQDNFSSRVSKAFTTEKGIPGIGSYSRGSNAQTAAARYQGSLDVKNAQYNFVTRRWEQPALSDGKYYLTYRFAGIGITGVSSRTAGGLAAGGTAEAITNPHFTSDSISASGTSESNPATTYTGGATEPAVSHPNALPAYGYGGGYHEITGGLYFYGTGVQYGGRPAWPGTIAEIGTEGSAAVHTRTFNNRKSAINNDSAMAKQAFLLWKTTEAGEHYWNAAENYLAAHAGELSAYGITEAWQVLNGLFKISGDPTSQDATLIFYCCFMIGGSPEKIYYNTYDYSSGAVKNTAPTYLAVVNPVTTAPVQAATREQSGATLSEGAGMARYASPVSVKLGEEVFLEINNSFFNKASAPSANSQRKVSVYLVSGENVIELPNGGADGIGSPYVGSYIRADGQYFDGQSSGPIMASQSGSDGFYGAGTLQLRFMMPATAPTTGCFRVATSDMYTMAGDNGLPADDVLEIPYTTDGAITTPEISGGGGYSFTDTLGDMNIGLPQERSLHYIAWEEEPVKDDKGQTVEDPEHPGQPQMTGSYVEHWSGYGSYRSADTGICSSDSDLGETYPEDIYDKHHIEVPSLIDGEEIVAAWWEYDGNLHFPRDIDYKVWADGTDGYDSYSRSETSTHSFSVGTTVARSRGTDQTVESPKAKMWVYGVYPDDSLDMVEDDITSRFGSTNSDGSISITAVEGLSSYDYAYAYLKNIVIGNQLDIYYPHLKIVSEVDATKPGMSGFHGESGIFTSTYDAPAQNSWDEASDHAERTLHAEMDDMIIMEVEVTDSEGRIIYHADRYDNQNSSMTHILNDAGFDREEDLKIRVVVKQNESASHIVKDPTIDITVAGKTKSETVTAYYIPGTEFTSS